MRTRTLCTFAQSIVLRNCSTQGVPFFPLKKMAIGSIFSCRYCTCTYAMNASMGCLSKNRGSQYQNPEKRKIFVRSSIIFQEERLK